MRNVNTGATEVVTSNAQEPFVAADLKVDDYEIRASKTGFQTVVRKGITLTVGAQSVVDFSLAVGQQQQVASSVSPTYPTLAATGKFLPTGANGNIWNIADTPYPLQWNLNNQRELAQNTVLTVGHLGSRGSHLLMARNVNSNRTTVDANGRPCAFTNMIPTSAPDSVCVKNTFLAALCGADFLRRVERDEVTDW